MSARALPVEERFMRHVNASENCWEWTGSLFPTGYGQFGLNGQTQYAHRVAYELFVGPIPDGLTIDHLCRNPRCVNPAHLEPVTLRENILRSSGPSAVNARKTKCVRGHDLPATRSSRGDRQCRECRTLERRARGIPPRTRPSHCPQGHEYTPENTREEPRGIQCRACARDRQRARRLAAKAGR